MFFQSLFSFFPLSLGPFLLHFFSHCFCFPHWLSDPHVLGAFLCSVGAKGWGVWRRVGLLLLRATLLICEIPPDWFVLGWGFYGDHNVALLSFVVRSSSASLEVFFTGKWSVCNCRFCVSMGRLEFRIFLCAMYLMYFNSEMPVSWGCSKFMRNFYKFKVVYKQWYANKYI